MASGGGGGAAGGFVTRAFESMLKETSNNKKLSSLNSAIQTYLGVLSHDHQMDDSSIYDVVGSGLAGVILLAEQLNLNRVFSYNYHEKEDPNSKCVVCLNYFGDGDHARKLACRHVFHKDCFDGWLDHLNFNCPLCRSSLIGEERVESTRGRMGEDGLAWFAMR